ncbi:MAG TPA: carbohydrate-binding protein [Planctomycetota bacterium]|jgi:hypothetical protein|nr:carbohydrate-binding protein [Planctomycetota bacterium]
MRYPAAAAALAFVLAACASAESWPGPSRPFRGKIHGIPGMIEAEDFDEGGEGVAYHDAEARNLETRGAPYRESGVDLEWRPEARGGYNLGWTRPGEWLVYTVEVRESGLYRLDTSVACKGPGGTFRIEFGGVDRTGPIEIPDTGGWQYLKPLSREGLRLEAGRWAMRVVLDRPGASGSIGDIDFFTFTRVGP